MRFSPPLLDLPDDGLFDGVIDLAGKLAQSQQAQACAVTNWFRYGYGRVETAEDACTVARLNDALAANQGDFRALMLALTQTDTFMMNATPGQE